ncbi:hypothetical protein TNCV_1301901 [Trichonephila clavipes]|nr:hypothetical protein TNCV_1301901 [Trichonephila clavipes]
MHVKSAVESWKRPPVGEGGRALSRQPPELVEGAGIQQSALTLDAQVDDPGLKEADENGVRAEDLPPQPVVQERDAQVTPQRGGLKRIVNTVLYV